MAFDLLLFVAIHGFVVLTRMNNTTTKNQSCNVTSRKGSTAWVPILEPGSKLAYRSRNAIDDIARSLVTGDYRTSHGPVRQHVVYEEALLFGYLARTVDNRHWIDAATDRLNLALESLADCLLAKSRASQWMPVARHPALIGGLSGLAWTVNHLSSLLTDVRSGDTENGAPASTASSFEDVNAHIEMLLLHDLQKGRWLGHHDAMRGLAGMGLYFLDRLPRERARLGAELVVYHLMKLVEIDGPCVIWRNRANSVSPVLANQHQPGCYDDGIAYGHGGVVYFLSEALAEGVESEKVSRLVDGGVLWLLRDRSQRQGRAASAGPLPGRPSLHLSWCNGELGTAAILYQIAARRQRQDWFNVAQSLLNHCLDCHPANERVPDATLYHGSIGIAHIFNRLYHNQCDARFKQAAVVWYEHSLSMRAGQGGVAGFLSKEELGEGAEVTVNAGFLNGAIGIALGLLAAIVSVPPGWDRLLLLSAGLRAPLVSAAQL